MLWEERVEQVGRNKIEFQWPEENATLAAVFIRAFILFVAAKAQFLHPEGSCRWREKKSAILLPSPHLQGQG